MKYFVIADVTQKGKRIKPLTHQELSALGLDTSGWYKIKYKPTKAEQKERDKIGRAHSAILLAMKKVEEKSSYITTELIMNQNTFEILCDYGGDDLMNKEDGHYLWLCTPVSVKDSLPDNKIVAVSDTGPDENEDDITSPTTPVLVQSE